MELNLTPLQLTEHDDKRPIVIAGPCSAETEEQVMNTALQLAKKGVKLFRAGIWKPRTKPGGFEGVGEPGLAWMQEVQKETGMKVCTEVATHAHVEACLKAGVDLLWIGARTVANPFAMQEIADSLKGVDIPVLVKILLTLTLNYGLVVWNALTKQALHAWALFTVVSQPTKKSSTATYPCGTFLLNCAVAALACLSLATPATLVVSAN